MKVDKNVEEIYVHKANKEGINKLRKKKWTRSLYWIGKK